MNGESLPSQPMATAPPLPPLAPAGAPSQKKIVRYGSSLYVDWKKESEQSIRRIFEGNSKWVSSKIKTDPMYFDRMKHGQAPKYLFIGCADSRVPANEICGLDAGELFVHRNVANLVVHTDLNGLSVLQYAVERLKVQDILVCGHYGCGGVDAAMENKDLGLIDNWLRNIRDVSRLHHKELCDIPIRDLRHRRLVELNVMEQCINLYKTGIVQNHQRKYGFPRITGLVYDIATGGLQKLNVNFKTYADQYNDIYRLYDFPPPPDGLAPRIHFQKQYLKTLFDTLNVADVEAELKSVSFKHENELSPPVSPVSSASGSPNAPSKRTSLLDLASLPNMKRKNTLNLKLVLLKMKSEPELFNSQDIRNAVIVAKSMIDTDGDVSLDDMIALIDEINSEEDSPSAGTEIRPEEALPVTSI